MPESFPENVRVGKPPCFLLVQNISRIFWLRPLFCSQGERDRDADDCLEAFPILCAGFEVRLPPLSGSVIL